MVDGGNGDDKVMRMVVMVLMVRVLVVLTVKEQSQRGGERSRDVVVDGLTGEVCLHVVPRECWNAQLGAHLTITY